MAMAAYRGDVSGVKVWGFFQKGQAWVCVHHILKQNINQDGKIMLCHSLQILSEISLTEKCIVFYAGAYGIQIETPTSITSGLVSGYLYLCSRCSINCVT